MESNLCSVLLILSIISIPTALLNLYEKQKNTSKQQNTLVYLELYLKIVKQIEL